MAQKQIALSLRQLCSDPDSQAYIVREKQCMSGLMDLLSKDDDPEVLLITLQALSFLSCAPSNREPLVQSYPQLVVRLVSLSTSNDDNMQRVTSLANTILEHLESYINQEDGKKKQVPSRRQTMAPGIGRTDLYEGRRRGSSFTPKYQHEIILRVPDMMGERQRTDVERSLIAVKGVTSVTINMHMKQVVVYTGLAEDRILPLLIAAVATVGLDATRYRTSIAGASVATPASRRGSTNFANNDENATPSYLNSQTPSYLNAQTPSYLNPNTAKPVYQTKEAATMPTPTPTVTSTTPSYPSYANVTPGAPTTPSYVSPASAYYGAVTPHQGFEDSTLKARFAAKKNVEEAKKVQESRVKSLFGSVASYFW